MRRSNVRRQPHAHHARSALVIGALLAALIATPMASADVFLLRGGGRIFGSLEGELEGPDGRTWLAVNSAFGRVLFRKDLLERQLPLDRESGILFIEEIFVTKILGLVEISRDRGRSWDQVCAPMPEGEPTPTPTVLAEEDPRSLLLPGDRLRTGADGEVDLAVGYGVIHVAPESEVEFKRTRGSTLRASRGEFSTKLDELPRFEEFRVQTPSGLLGVKGTTFLVRLVPEGEGGEARPETRIAVTEGSIRSAWGPVEGGGAVQSQGARGVRGDLSPADRASFERLKGAFPIPKIEKVFVPAGEFRMGNPRGFPRSESPAHRVTVPPILMGRTEITNAQYRMFLAYMEASGDHSRCHPDEPRGKNHRPTFSPIDREDRDDHPVVGVDWYDAYAFCAWVGARLPTEAEWEYACRAGTETRFHWGDAINRLPDYAWFASNARSTTHPVARKRPNAFGLYDMYGNAIEWCLDHWHDTYEGAPADGSPWLAEGGDAARVWVFRGGGWTSPAHQISSSLRGRGQWGDSQNGGFRPVWEPRGE